jgi:F420-dependent oxidoreductase-like protein
VYDLSQLRIFTEPQQGATYDDLLAVAQRAEQLGFGAFFRSDHYLAMGEALTAGGLPGPTDAWTTLAGLARDTTTIRLGTLVTAGTFRLPGVLAIAVANVDQMSGGRVELGLGAGWYEQEHTAYGIPFPDLGERFERLEEQLEIVTGLWSTPTGERFSFTGRHYQLADSPALPKPSQGGNLPIIVGGGGKHRTPRLTARFASEFNLGFRSVDDFTEQRQRVLDACSSAGRDPATMTFSAALVVVIGRDEAEFSRRSAAIDRNPNELREQGIAGVVAEASAVMERWQQAGADRLYLQVLDLGDLDHLDVIASMASSSG